MKLAGFQSSVSLFQNGVKNKKIFHFAGFSDWVAPEIIAQNEMYNEKADIYSFGILAIELLFGKTPFEDWEALRVCF